MLNLHRPTGITVSYSGDFQVETQTTDRCLADRSHKNTRYGDSLIEADHIIGAAYLYVRILRVECNLRSQRGLTAAWWTV